MSDYERLALREFGIVTIERGYPIGISRNDVAKVEVADANNWLAMPFNVRCEFVQWRDRNNITEDSVDVYTLRAVRAEVV